MKSNFAIISISRSSTLPFHLNQALSGLGQGMLNLHTNYFDGCEASPSITHQVLDFTRKKAEGFLLRQKSPVDVHLIHATSIDALKIVIGEGRLVGITAGMVIHDLTDCDEDHEPSAILSDLDAIYQVLADGHCNVMRSSFSDIVFKSQ